MAQTYAKREEVKKDERILKIIEMALELMKHPHPFEFDGSH